MLGVRSTPAHDGGKLKMLRAVPPQLMVQQNRTAWSPMDTPPSSRNPALRMDILPTELLIVQWAKRQPCQYQQALFAYT